MPQAHHPLSQGRDAGAARTDARCRPSAAVDAALAG